MTMQRRTVSRALLLAAAAAALVFAPAAASTGRYTDEEGDSRGAPDITGVTVASDAAGQIVFTVTVDDLPQAGDIQTYLLLDTDLDSATGAPDAVGADYIFVLDQADSSYGFGRWTGTDWDPKTPYATVRIMTRRSGISISVNRSELGNTDGFNFWLRARLGSGAETDEDTAPDLGVWNYSLAAGGPDIRSVLVSTTPGAGPKAGRAFSVRPAGLKLPPAGEAPLILPQPDSYSCRALLAGRALRGSGAGRCTWKLTKSARGKRLAVALTVTYEGAAKTFDFAYRVS